MALGKSITIKKRVLKNIKGKTICRFPSSKPNSKTVYTEGVLEKDFCYHLEADDDVVAYECQPLGFFYYIDGKKHQYTPDFKVTYADGSSQYFEVKERQYLPPDFYETFAIIQKQAQLLGIPLSLITDETILKEPLITNLKTLFRAKNDVEYSKDFEVVALFILSKVKSITIEQLLENSGYSGNLGLAFKFIQLGKIKCDIKQQELGLNAILEGTSHD